MFKRFRLRLKDIRTINQLISGADEQAHIMGEEKPGAEHYLLSALKLPDASALRVFESIGTDPEKLKSAIKKQYTEALSSIGIDGSRIMEKEPEPITPNRVLHNSKPSAQALMKDLYTLKKNDTHRPLLGAHVVNVVAHMEHGVAARTLKAMGIEKAVILSAVKEELDSFRC